jgi:hypothetical protein
LPFSRGSEVMQFDGHLIGDRPVLGLSSPPPPAGRYAAHVRLMPSAPVAGATLIFGYLVAAIMASRPLEVSSCW